MLIRVRLHDTEIGDHDGDGALDVVVGYAYQPIDWLNGLLGAVNVFLSFAAAQLAGSPDLDIVARHAFTREDQPHTELIVAQNVTAPACGRH